MSNNKTNVFQAVQEKFSIVAVAQDLGLSIRRIGGSYRADSIDPAGGGENALALNTSTNSWFDFKLGIGGDITALVAHVKFGGSMKEALPHAGIFRWQN